MNITIRSSDISELAENPGLIPKATNTAAAVSGTGAFIAPIAMLRELAGSPDVAQLLAEIADALEEQEAEEDTVSAWPADTGVDHAMKILPRAGARHGPRIKVAIDPPDRFRSDGVEATVPFDATSIGTPIPDIVPARLLSQVRAYIELNRETLIAFYNDEISGLQLASRLQRIS